MFISYWTNPSTGGVITFLTTTCYSAYNTLSMLLQMLLLFSECFIYSKMNTLSWYKKIEGDCLRDNLKNKLNDFEMGRKILEKLWEMLKIHFTAVNIALRGKLTWEKPFFSQFVIFRLSKIYYFKNLNFPFLWISRVWNIIF